MIFLQLFSLLKQRLILWLSTTITPRPLVFTYTLQHFTFGLLTGISETADVILKKANQVKIEIGEELTFKCELDGSPIPQIKWYKNKVRYETNVCEKSICVVFLCLFRSIFTISLLLGFWLSYKNKKMDALIICLTWVFQTITSWCWHYIHITHVVYTMHLYFYSNVESNY